MLNALQVYEIDIFVPCGAASVRRLRRRYSGMASSASRSFICLV